MLLRALILLGCVAVAPAAYAQATVPPNTVQIPPQNNQQQTAAILKAGSAFLPVAKKFDCDKFAWGSFSPNGNLALEYLPAADSVENWTHMMTITVYGLPEDAPTQITAMRQMMGQLIHIGGKVIQEDTMQDKNGVPRLFIEYEIGDGLMKEHSSGAFLKTGTRIAAFVQIQTRNVPVNPIDAVNMKLFAENKLPITQGN